MSTTENKPSGWLSRLKAGLTRTSRAIADGIDSALHKRKLDAEALASIEESLIAADLGAATAARLTQNLAKTKFGKEVTPEEVRNFMADEIAALLEPVARPLVPDAAHKPHVILVIGVNGTGKTTTIGKLAKAWADEGRQVVLVAGDTFRAAAVEQLKIWGTRANVPVVSGREGGDAAGLAFDGLSRARDENADLLLIDTAGRLQNKADLMAELDKIVRVLRKLDADAPHDIVLVLDATTGQNAHSQVELFKALVPLTGLIVTKLDGTAKGGVVVALAERFGLPVFAIGVGETAHDLRPFEARSFARGLLGMTE